MFTTRDFAGLADCLVVYFEDQPDCQLTDRVPAHWVCRLYGAADLSLSFLLECPV